MCGTGGFCINGKAIYISGKTVGLNKMYDIFEELYESGKRPENISGNELLEKLSFCNYIPPGLEKEYEEAVTNEYRIYCLRGG